MNNAQYRKILEKLELTIIGAAPILGVSRRQAQRYAADDTIPGPVAKLMQIMADGDVTPADVERLK